ncbi:MAG: metalloregulator ArsR/SmtB family transcription factor [Verrucomicrobiota bacterium]|nr:metalloregulator ArsR/SmtB family transcription factor [Verrucomicrobiota bacterium]
MSNHSNDKHPCGHDLAHDVAVKRMTRALQNEDISFELAELFKAFGDSTRVRILGALQAGELCVCALAETLAMTPSAISHQLRLLKQLRLIRARKEGKSVFYMLNDDHIHLIFALAYEHVTERKGRRP